MKLALALSILFVQRFGGFYLVSFPTDFILWPSFHVLFHYAFSIHERTREKEGKTTSPNEIEKEAVRTRQRKNRRERGRERNTKSYIKKKDRESAREKEERINKMSAAEYENNNGEIEHVCGWADSKLMVLFADTTWFL